MPYEPFANQGFRNVVQTHFEIPALLRLLPVPFGGRMLEIGCGRGVALPSLAALCAPIRLVGVDIDPDLVEIARRHAARWRVDAELLVADARALPFPAESFDVVLDFGTCYHIDHPDIALREIARVLASGGRFIHESTLAQRIAHPFRTSGRSLPWSTSPDLKAERGALLWASRMKTPSAAS
jgi:ubiquinone/menaquinone biosynthesis C-methylase UbiE